MRFLPGNVFIIPPHIAHGYYPYSSLDVYHILIHCSYFRRYARELHAFPGYTALFEIEPFLRGVVDKNLFLFLPAHQLQALKEKLALLEQMRGMEYAGKNSMMNAYTLYLIGILSLEMSQLNSDREQDDSDFRFILAKQEYIRAHFSEKLTAEWLGQARLACRAPPICGIFQLFASHPDRIPNDLPAGQSKGFACDNLTDHYRDRTGMRLL